MSNAVPINGYHPGNKKQKSTFRPLLFGIIKKYQFTIYNRWGEKVFQSVEPGQGWNGINAGSQQDTNLYTWVCSYQLEGEVSKVKRGTVLLIR